MKKEILFLILIVSGFSTMSQERFFEFLPGWRNHIVIPNDSGYISYGLGSLEFSQHFFQFNSLSLQGMIDSSWIFSIDTATSTSSHGYPNSVLPFDNSNYISGLAVGEIGGKVFGTLIEFDQQFMDTIRTSVYNLSIDTRMHIVIKNNENNLIVGGEQELSFANYFPFLYEMDLDGNIIWSKSYSCGNNCDLIPYHIQKASDNGYFFTCKESHDLGSGNYSEKTAIIKTDSLGNEEYRLHPGNPDLFTVAGWVLPTDDGNFITAYSDPNTITDNLPQNNPNKTIWINKFDINGNEIFNISLLDYLPKISGIGFKYFIKQMLITSDGNILIVGYKTTAEDFGFMLKITQQGVPLWFRFISPPQAEGNDAGAEWTKILGITPTADGGYIMAGEYFSSPGNLFPDGIQTAIAVKVDEFGCLDPGCQIGDDINELTKANLGLQVYPNPANEIVNISVGENVKVKQVRIYEVMCRVVLVQDTYQSPQPPPPRGSSISLDVSGLVPGMYLLEVETKDGYREVKRLVIE